MKKLVLALLVSAVTINLCLAQQISNVYYDVVPANGNGVRFWSGDNWKMHMGNAAEYHYGPVTDYSIKMNMDGTTGRGWTWGAPGGTPVAAIGNQGNMQIFGSFSTGGNVGIGTSTPSNNQGWDRVLDVSAPTASKIIATAVNQTYRVGMFANNSWYGGGGFIGTETNHNLNFITNYTSRMTLDVNGNVGIGTTTPAYPLHVASPAGDAGLMIAASGKSTQIFLHVAAGDYGYLGLGGNTSIRGNGHTSSFDGAVAIGTTNPGSYKLAVEGKIGAREVNVIATNPWPDYVFGKEYKLSSLEEIKNYIDQNKHLPEVPSATEVEKNGVNLGEMNALLLKKIEELTLHILKQEERIKALEAKK